MLNNSWFARWEKWSPESLRILSKITWELTGGLFKILIPASSSPDSSVLLPWTQLLGLVWLFVAPWTVAHQAPLSMEFSSQEYWSGLGISFYRGSSRPRDWTWVSCVSCIGRQFLPLAPVGKPRKYCTHITNNRNETGEVYVDCTVTMKGLSIWPPKPECPGSNSCSTISLCLRLSICTWHPTPVLLPGKSHGRRSLVGCSPWGH